MCRIRCSILLIVVSLSGIALAEDYQPLAHTQPLDWDGDIASRMIDGVDKFLLDELEKSIQRRSQHWHRDLSSTEAYNESIQSNRQRLAHLLGVRDQRKPFGSIELVSTTNQPALVGQGLGYKVFAVRWPVIRDIHGEGLLLIPDREPVADIVAIPDADQTPEQIVGLTKGVVAELQFARRFAESGCRVIVPTLVSRSLSQRNVSGHGGGAKLTNREFLYRAAFELGRHLIGYEVQKILAAVDWFGVDAVGAAAKTGVIGYGEGGMLAQYAGAIDPRIDVVGSSGYFGPRERVWEQPIDRNVFGLLEQFGDAEIGSMIAPRDFIIDVCRGPKLELPGEGGAPARLVAFGLDEITREYNRFNELVNKLHRPMKPIRVSHENKNGPSDVSQNVFLCRLVRDNDQLLPKLLVESGPAPQHLRSSFDPLARQHRQIHEIDVHNQWLLREGPFIRKEFMKNLDVSSIAAYQKSLYEYREFFRNEIIGHFNYELLPANPRSRKINENEQWTRYEVVLDVFPDVFAYGILTVPKDIRNEEKRPVVVCQHGLEGRPQHVIGDEGYQYYKAFATALAERGFITFAPQNIYIFQDRFRTLQRKANPLGKTLFSIMVPQHQQIVDWLQSLPNVDPERIAFYGLSYGGKSAMRIPALVTDYCLSICSADFNEWVRKNASTRHFFSYVWHGEYEIFEFDLGSTFNYAEMAALICPRPFMVERGYFDGVGEDEWVAFEFAKVRRLYAAKLRIPDRCEIEWFVGPHTINGKGTYEFLHRHLDWPQP